MYIVMELQKNGDAALTHLVTGHESLPEAESKFYSVLAAAAVSDVSVHSAIIISEEGFPVRHQCYRHGAEGAAV